MRIFSSLPVVDDRRPVADCGWVSSVGAFCLKGASKIIIIKSIDCHDGTFWSYFLSKCTFGSKIPFSPRFLILRKEFIAYLNCYPRQLKIKDLPSIIGCEPIRSFKKLFSQNLPPLRLRVFCCRLHLPCQIIFQTLEKALMDLDFYRFSKRCYIS